MSDVIVSVSGLPANAGILAQHIALHTCPHCGEAVPAFASRWEFTQRAGRAYPCPACTEDMHADFSGEDSALSLDDLTGRQRDVLQAISENQPIRHEELARKSGVSERTVTNAVRVLKKLGVKSTGAGYTFEKLP